MQNKKFICSQSSKIKQMESTDKTNWKLHSNRNTAQKLNKYDTNFDG